jgi:stage II sporulation protein R
LLVLSSGNVEKKEEYLRLHIRANSNQEVDQNIKMQVKDVVVEYLTPHIAKCTSKEETMKMLKEETDGVYRAIEAFLLQNGFSYGAKTTLKSEYFPTRVYDDLTLEAGVYDALIIELGDGVGDNWWCVVYPPLCFSDTKNVKYRSIIYDIIKQFKERTKS